MNLTPAIVLIAASFSLISCQKYNYTEVIEKSLLFYEAQRSGKLPANNRIPWRGDSMLNDKDGDVDLTGGYFDAGDHVKFNFPLAWAISTLAMGGIDFKSGYTSAGQFDYLLDAVKWGADYFFKCHTGETELYVQVGDATADHNWWDLPERWTDVRPTYKVTAERPGSDIAGETSALFSAASILFRGINDTYSNELLDHAKSLYEFAMAYRGKYSDSVPEATPYYTSNGFADELVWAASWLFRATNDIRYRTDADDLIVEYDLSSATGFSWDSKISGADVNLYETTHEEKYAKRIISFCDDTIDNTPRTPKGLVFIFEWGSLRALSNVIFICLQAARMGINDEKYIDFATSQIDLMLGDWGRSFVCGFGNDPPIRPHHRSSSCPNPPETCGWSFFNSELPNANILYGALVGGPNLLDEYEDVRNDAVKNEVAVDYNAAFQGSIAALKQFSENDDGENGDNGGNGLTFNYQIALGLLMVQVTITFLMQRNR
ncbi:Endoglucanase E-4 [Pseudolycoriella hygida]|uniref:cellulase n=1 Tax=Pseudolycoriella hygida TaxID=35572 RepID=A0A9Q0N598_9DIPT|nr:Endoglucanase E-4 [Pseudolycoriella hygida]